MILYHGTTKENKETILQEGFKTTYGDYGECVYLAKHKDLAYDYGDEIIEVFVDYEEIITIKREDIKDRLDLEYMAYKNDYKAVCVVYSNVKLDKDQTEVCVYDLSVIEINK